MVAIEVCELMASEQLADAIAALHDHYAEVVLPLWRGRGFHSTLSLPFEAAMIDHVPEPKRFRAMACARQLYIFSEAGDREHADRLFGSLVKYFRDANEGGFFYSVGASGEPLETDKDLYTHAFVIFACAAYLLRFQMKAARMLLEETTDVVMSRFSRDPSTGVLNAVVSPDFSLTRIGPRQNPLMHLTEAYLLALKVSKEQMYSNALDELLAGIAHHFVDPHSGCVMELLASDPQSWIEPGHQFEWYFLSTESDYPGFSRSGLADALSRAFAFAQSHGVDALTGGVAASLDRNGTILDGTQRIWAQTEYLRALVHHLDFKQETEVSKQIRLFQTRFLHKAGWHECLSPLGEVLRNDMPSTSPYHLATAYAALHDF